MQEKGISALSSSVIGATACGRRADGGGRLDRLSIVDPKRRLDFYGAALLGTLVLLGIPQGILLHRDAAQLVDEDESHRGKPQRRTAPCARKAVVPPTSPRGPALGAYAFALRSGSVTCAKRRKPAEHIHGLEKPVAPNVNDAPLRRLLRGKGRWR
jgi:hypothetical protein